ncbi:FitA-like ribbon-helix-helix domain-containing protein [Maricaulis salignorans]|uniref:FitA-like ribbon-helix-helix domain-containing protein n=1 Tax=Maricaulis salignorans TaxID=144026 RepID=UPI003A941013
MGQILIRNLDDEVIAKLKLNAESASTSLEQYLRELLTAKVMSDKEAFLAFAKGMQESSRPSDLDPTDLIREDRDR